MQNKFKNKYRISSARLQTWDYSINGAYFITICTQNRHHFFGHIKNQEMQLSEIGKLAEKFWYEIPNHFSMVELGNFVVMPNHVHGILIIDNISIHDVETRFIASDINEMNNSRFIASDINEMNNSRFIASDINEMNNSRFIASDINEMNNSRFIASDINEMNNSRFIASDINEMNNSRFIASDNDDLNNDNKETRLIASLQGRMGRMGGTGGFSGDRNPMLGNSISKIVRWYKGRCSFECRKINPNFTWQSRFHDHIIRNSKSFDTIQNYIEQNPLKWKEDIFYNYETNN